MTSFYLTLALAIFVLAAMMWRYDMHRREPWYMLLLAILLGALARPCIGAINDWLFTASGSSSLVLVAALAGVGEELIKVAAVLLIATGFRNHFDDPMDGMVYGAFVGLGFAISESCSYIPDTLRSMPDVTQAELFGQESIRAVLHYLTGAIGGFGLGLARCRVYHWRSSFARWLGASILIHFLWDYACGLSTADDLSGAIFQRTAALALMAVAIVLFRVAIAVCNRWAKLTSAGWAPVRH